MSLVKRLAQGFVLKTALRWAVLRRAYARLYAMALDRLRACARSLPVKALCLRQGLLEKEWLPGASDVDTLWVLDDLPLEKDRRTRDLLNARLARLKNAFPFLGEAQITDPAGLRLYGAWGDAKRRTADHWVLLEGARGSLSDQEAPSWKTAWDGWAQAFEAYELLLKCLFPPEKDGSLRRRLSARKHLLDVFRWGQWAASPENDLPAREEAARQIREGRADPPPDWAPPLDRARGFPLEELPAMAAWAMETLEALGRRLTDLWPKDPFGGPRWPSRYRDDAWESQAGEKRFSHLKAVAGDAVKNILWNTLTHSTVILQDRTPSRAREEFLKTLARLKSQDPGFQIPVVAVTESLFQMRLWSLDKGTPFAFFSLRQDGPADRARAWRLSSKSLLRGQSLGQARPPAAFVPPPAPVLTALAREAAANWLLHWRNAFYLSVRSSPLYVWKSLVSPLLMTRLFLEGGMAGDPEDMEGALLAYRAAFPAESAWADALLQSLETEGTDRTRPLLERLHQERYTDFHRAAAALRNALERR